MKTELEKHISIILESIGLNCEFSIFPNDFFETPELIKGKLEVSENIVCVYDTLNKRRLQNFIGKEVVETDEFLYWIEGGRQISTPEKESISSSYTKIEPRRLKSQTRLPVYLDKMIFNQLGGIYAPDFNRFEHNLDLNHSEVLNYLGTYFPRSYSESFCIFSSLFEKNKFCREISKQNELNILSIGCGTGGDILGLLASIDKYIAYKKRINIIAIDGSEEALDVLDKLISELSRGSKHKIVINRKFQRFESLQDLNLDLFEIKQFDFVLSFKLVCEIIALGNGNNDDSYYVYLEKVLPKLTNSGVCLLLDVTTKQKHTTYNPILLNSQTNQFLKDNNKYASILPRTCFHFENKCNHSCFSQKIFKVTHQKKVNDISKVSFRLIGRKNFVERIVDKKIQEKLYITSNSICPYSEEYDRQGDAFLIN